MLRRLLFPVLLVACLILLVAKMLIVPPIIYLGNF